MAAYIKDEATQRITSSPSSIELDRWHEIFTAYAAHDDKTPRILPTQITEWEIFRKFLNGDIPQAEYYTNKTTRAAVETVTNALAHNKFKEYRADINAALYQRIQAGKQNRHWTEEAIDPQNRMYLDAARLINKGLIEGIAQWESGKFMAPDRALYEAQVDDKITDGFDEALLSPNLNIDNMEGFVADVIRKRLLDFHRTRLGRHETTRENRPRFTSLESPLYTNDNGRTVSMRDTLEDEPDINTNLQAINGAALIAQIQRFAGSLSPKRRQVLTTFLEEKARDDEANSEEMAAKIGISASTFDSHMRTIREQLIAFNPDLKEDVIRFFGATPTLIRRMEEKYGENGLVIKPEEHEGEISGPQLPLTTEFQPIIITNDMPEPQTTMSTSYENYAQSLGMQIKLRRDERKMSLQNVADAVMGSMAGDTGISAEQVRRWEQARELPNDEQVAALAITLIDENDVIQNKEQARRNFMHAYECSKAALAGQDATDDDRYAFANMLSEQREQFSRDGNKVLSLEGVAKKASEHIKIAINDQETEWLRADPKGFIASIEAGAVIPSKGMVHALVKAFNKVQILSEDENRVLYDAYECSAEVKTEPLARVTKRLPIAGSVLPRVTEPSFSGDEALEQTGSELSPRVQELRSAIRKLFVPENDQYFTLSSIGVSVGIPHNRISALMGQNSNADPTKVSALTQGVRDKLIVYLNTHNHADKVAEFEELFDEMRQVTHYTGLRGRKVSASVGME